MDAITQKTFDKFVAEPYGSIHYSSNKKEKYAQVENLLEFCSQSGFEISQVFWGVGKYYSLFRQNKTAIKLRVRKNNLTRYAFAAKLISMCEFQRDLELVEIKMNKFFYFTVII